MGKTPRRARRIQSTRTDHRYTPRSADFESFIAANWAPRTTDLPPMDAPAAQATQRRFALGQAFPGQRLVIPAGTLVTRSNDTDYRFRPHSAFSYLTGLGSDHEADAVLVLEPRDNAEETPTVPEATASALVAVGEFAESPTHHAVLYVRPRDERDTPAFYADAQYGELWVGPRPTLAEFAARTGLTCRHLDQLDTALTAGITTSTLVVRVVADADRRITTLLTEARKPTLTRYQPLLDAERKARIAARKADRAQQKTEQRAYVTRLTELGMFDPNAEPRPGLAATGEPPTLPVGIRDHRNPLRLAAPALPPLPNDAIAVADAQLDRFISEQRLVKTSWEIEQLRTAVEVTARGFADIASQLETAIASPRGERVIESVFERRAREEGNGLGYDTIAASGPHACTLHWIRNNGPVRSGDLVLIDAGVELESLYTADVTRTLPVNGTFNSAQREVYQAVLDAADAAFAVTKPGVRFRDVNDTAMRVIATWLHEHDLLPGSVEETLHPDGQFHRRWMPHGISHHVGLDVHDCAAARKAMYLDAELRPGMVFTIEPGLYFQPDDLLVPEELRGIGVRIEDDVLVTDTGYENLSAMLPRDIAGVETWLANHQKAT